ncbi:MAG: hypothetical protein OK457_09740 [Thaumarchaeota archaeon]|nr:hypothetical protein [Nitrososphaerota archaeon]
MAISVFLRLVLMSTGAIASVLLTSGYYGLFFLVIGITAIAVLYSERKDRNFQEILQDKPAY